MKTCEFTPEQLEQLAAAKRAHAEGKPIQFCAFHSETWTTDKAENPAWEHFYFRPELEPTLRDWAGPEDVPGPVCWLHRKSAVQSRGKLVVNVIDSGVFLYDEYVGWPSMWNFEYSTTRLPGSWKPCQVEVTQP